MYPKNLKNNSKFPFQNQDQMKCPSQERQEDITISTDVTLEVLTSVIL